MTASELESLSIVPLIVTVVAAPVTIALNFMEQIEFASRSVPGNIKLGVSEKITFEKAHFVYAHLLVDCWQYPVARQSDVPQAHGALLVIALPFVFEHKGNLLQIFAFC